MSAFRASFDMEDAAAAAAEAIVEEILAGAGDDPPLSVSYTRMPPSFLEIKHDITDIYRKAGAPFK